MSHYNKDYFEWYKQLGLLAGEGNLFLYDKYIQSSDKVVDFGCGGGFLLAKLEAKEKIGVEINPEARKHAESLGLKTAASVGEVPDGWADVIISCHVLEHTHQPLDELRALFPKLKSKGKIVFVVPYERNAGFKKGDINQHLYTWSQMNLGNLFETAGYSVIKVEEIHHRFPPKGVKLRKILGKKLFYVASKINGNLHRKCTQIRVLAEKP